MSESKTQDQMDGPNQQDFIWFDVSEYGTLSEGAMKDERLETRADCLDIYVDDTTTAEQIIEMRQHSLGTELSHCG